ncbi:hypothetical protein C8R44DRAFT_987251 [Mycena epipterygia]|nr:hypothetical protein C8R44DRAFT_987251 [Mycena epipterygia]
MPTVTCAARTFATAKPKYVVPPVCQLLIELAVAYTASALLILAALHLAAVPFPVLAALQITFICTLVVLATLRAVGALCAASRSPQPDSCDSQQKMLGSDPRCDVPEKGCYNGPGAIEMVVGGLPPGSSVLYSYGFRDNMTWPTIGQLRTGDKEARWSSLICLRKEIRDKKDRSNSEIISRAMRSGHINDNDI